MSFPRCGPQRDFCEDPLVRIDFGRERTEYVRYCTRAGLLGGQPPRHPEPIRGSSSRATLVQHRRRARCGVDTFNGSESTRPQRLTSRTRMGISYSKRRRARLDRGHPQRGGSLRETSPCQGVRRGPPAARRERTPRRHRLGQAREGPHHYHFRRGAQAARIGARARLVALTGAQGDARRVDEYRRFIITLAGKVAGPIASRQAVSASEQEAITDHRRAGLKGARATARGALQASAR